MVPYNQLLQDLSHVCVPVIAIVHLALIKRPLTDGPHLFFHRELIFLLSVYQKTVHGYPLQDEQFLLPVPCLRFTYNL